MKLPFDQTLLPKLVNSLAELFLGPSHVQSVGLARKRTVSLMSSPSGAMPGRLRGNCKNPAPNNP
jgi:hypothetical protein